MRQQRAMLAAAVFATTLIATTATADAHRGGRQHTRRHTTVVREGDSIQAAIDSAVGMTKIIVKGHHVENVWIDKSGIELVGRSGASLTLPDDPTSNPCQGANPETGETFDSLVCVHPASGEFPVPPGEELRDVTVTGLSLSGSTGDSIAALFTHDLEISRNTIEDPGCDGIFTLFADSFVISGNTVSNSTGCVGIRAAASTDGQVSHNTSTGNAFSGIDINDSSHVKVQRNVVSGNCVGIVVSNAPDPAGLPVANVTVTRNVANANNSVCYPFDPPGSQTAPVGATGIVVAGAIDTVVNRNTTNDNVTDEFTITAAGILVTDFPGDDPSVPFAVSENTTVERNTATGNTSAVGPVDLSLTTIGTLASVRKNQCGVSVPDPGWCGGAPLASRFAEGGELAGSTNGISFAPDGTLWIANVFGATITQIDPDSGAILDRLTAADGVFFPDDVIVGPDGTIYWTEIALGTVFKKPVGQPAFPLLPIPFGLNSANPLTLSDDGRLFAAGCYGGPPLNNSFVEIDPVNGGIINTLRSDIPGCASNGMSWNDGALYSPQPFTGEILRVDPDTGDLEVVTSGWPVPIGTAFDSNGDLYALAQGVGEVVRVDLANPDTANNRTVIAEIPVGWADNIAISADDRIFISSATDSTIAEVLDDGSLRTVVPGQFQFPGGIAVIGDTLYMVNPGQVIGWDRDTREQTSIFRSAFGVTEYPPATFGVAWGDHLVLTSAISGQIMVWDPVNEVPIAQNVLAGPGDVEPFEGGLVVHESQTGNVLRLDADLNVVETIANVPGGTGLASKGGDLYLADGLAGTILQLIDNGHVLASPEIVVDGLSTPEGIDIQGRRLYVVESGAQRLTRIHLPSGHRTVIAKNLGLAAPVIPEVFPFGLLNNVVVDGHDVYVNADRANVIYEF